MPSLEIEDKKPLFQSLRENYKEMKRAHQREWMIRRYQKWAAGEILLEDKFVEFLTKVKTRFVLTWRRATKRFLDIFLSIFGLIVLAPVILFVVIGSKLTSRGPVLFRQERVGRRGRPFMMYKFRSMIVDAEKKSGPVWAKEDDPRITKFGNFLRKTHLDEIPQFLNVLRGDMSLVGPRPERPHFVNDFRKSIPRYDLRHYVRPGITGLAQVRRGYDETLRDVKCKLRYDVLYVERMCPFLDIAVLFMTFKTVFGRMGR